MSRPHALDLYEHLPALYRLRDAEQGYPLRALLKILSEQVDLLKDTSDRQWDDLFIETCSRWVIPYIGDLVANNALHDVDRSRLEDQAMQLFPDLRGPDLLPDLAIPLRADVAKTIYYRRRKGTLPMLEELARDVTGWGAHAVEFFRLLDWTQHMNHLRLDCHEHPDIRSVERIERVHGPFDEASHCADVRRPTQAEGWHNIPNIGFFLWRLRSYPLDRVEARPADPSDEEEWRFHFSPLGNPAPLFTRWRREGDEAGLATELHTPGPICRPFFCEDLRRHRSLPTPRPDATDLYGLPREEAGLDIEPHLDWSLFIRHNGNPVPPERIVCWRLADWPASRPPDRPPAAEEPVQPVIGVDVETGRMVLSEGWGEGRHQVDVSFHYGFSADLGGGTYDRRKWLLRREDYPSVLLVRKDGSVPDAFTSLEDALDAWQGQDPERDTLIRILDSRTYLLPSSIRLGAGCRLTIEAENGQRPLLRTPVDPGLEMLVEPPEGTAEELTLSGIVVEGHLHVEGDLKRLRLLHTTLVPGRRLRPDDGRPAGSAPSLRVSGESLERPLNTRLRIEIAASITGPLHLPAQAAGLWLLDSIVDGTRDGSARGPTIAGPDGEGSGPPTTLERVTVFGRSAFAQLSLASEAIFTAPLEVERTQGGCVRFSYVPDGSRTPERFRCQPDLAISERVTAQEDALGRGLSDAERAAIAEQVNAWLAPAYTAFYYGLPGYAQLGHGCPVEILRGAEDGAEMGAFSRLWQPQRETNLRIRLDEYLPFGLDPGLIDVT